MLKDWNIFEKFLLIGSPTIVAIVAILFKSDPLTTICAIVGIFTALLLAKGKSVGNIFGIIVSILYSIVSFNNKYFGEVIIYVFVMLPMFIMGLISWVRHPNEETNTVTVNTIDKKEWGLLSLVTCAVFVGIYFLLKAFDTNELIVSTISFITCLFAMYLQIRRCRYMFYPYIINDIMLMVLWIIPVINGDLLLLPMVFNPIINFINDAYGAYNWKKLENEQRK